MLKFHIILSKFENSSLKKNNPVAADRKALMEFHIRREVREQCGLEGSLFSLTGNVFLADIRQVRALTQRLNEGVDPVKNPGRFVRSGELNAMGLIDEILHYIVALYREQIQPDVFTKGLERLEKKLGTGKTGDLLEGFCGSFPPRDVYGGKTTVSGYLEGSDGGESCRCLSL